MSVGKAIMWDHCIEHGFPKSVPVWRTPKGDISLLSSSGFGPNSTVKNKYVDVWFQMEGTPPRATPELAVSEHMWRHGTLS